MGESMVKKRFAIAFAISAPLLIQLACGITINPGGEQVVIPLETSVVLTIAALPAGKPANPQVVVINPTATLPLLSPQINQTPSATPLPCNKPQFISETIPDNTTFNPNQYFVKTWTVRNNGICTWDGSYHFIYIEGTQMNGPTSMNLPKVVVPGDTVTISLSLKAPSANGSYTGVWRFQSGSGEIFGNYWAKISVGVPAPPFAVTGVYLSAEHPGIEGTCPQSFHIGADITVNGPGTVTYWFQHSNGTISAASSVTFTAAGTKMVTESWSRNATGSYWAKIYINTPNHQWFGQVNLHLTCS